VLTQDQPCNFKGLIYEYSDSRSVAQTAS